MRWKTSLPDYGHVPSSLPRRWQLEGFLELFDQWIAVEGLEEYGDLPLIVLNWVHARARNPYAGVRREPDLENLWWGKIPESADNRGRVVVCSYFIYESESRIQCATFGWLTGPFV